VTAEKSTSAEILQGNPWYIDSQFRAQMSTPGRRRVIEDRWAVYASMIESWRGRGHSSSGMRVLDAGCGDGINVVGLRRIAVERAWPMRLAAVDFNMLRLQRVRERIPSLTPQQASLYALPFVSRCFDIAVCTHVLEHVPDLAAALRELRRVLAPGGLLIVGVPNEGCAMGRLRNHTIQRRLGRTTDHVHFFTDSSLERALETAGFGVTRIERETFFFPVSYLNMLCNEWRLGHLLMGQLRRWFPSQAGGLIVAAVAPNVS
jgi:ubiquinone/menaquinone biosynthesis C-methylase UbiE